MLRGTQVCGYSLGLKIAYCAVPDPILEGSGGDLTCVSQGASPGFGLWVLSRCAIGFLQCCGGVQKQTRQRRGEDGVSL